MASITNHNLKLIWAPLHFDTKRSFLLLLSGIMYAVFYVTSVYTLSELINRISDKSIYESHRLLFSYLFLQACMFFLTNIQTYFEKGIESLSFVKIKDELTLKKLRMKYSLNDDPDVLDLFNLVGDYDKQVVSYIHALVFFITLFFQIIFVLILLSFFSIKTAIFLALFSICIIFLVVKGGSATYIANKKVQPLERKKDKIASVMTDFSYAEERLTYSFSSFFSARFNTLSKETRKLKNKALSTWFRKAQYGGISFIILLVIISFFLMTALKTGEISFGLFSSLFICFIQLSELMSWNLSDNVDTFIKALKITKDYQTIMGFTEETDKTNVAITNEHNISTIKFENVSFTYPYRKNAPSILSNVNLSLEPGKYYSIVGKNGCGKSTITKILLGLYDNYSGKILFYGNELNKYPTDFIASKICVVYQDFANYFIPIKDFIQLGTKTTLIDTEIIDIFSKIGIDFSDKKYPLGLQTPLGNIIENGTNISGGEWQKLCLARAILSNKEIIILDEPTSAIDPISESKVLDTFLSLCKGKTIIQITHRLNTVIDSDSIIVIKNGTIIEQGSHDYLYNLHGYYYDMFNTQKKWYQQIDGGNFHEE